MYAFVASVLVWLVASTSLAVAQSVPFNEKSLSVDALVDALAPDEPFGRTRNLRLAPPGGAASQVPRTRPEAPILLTFATNSATLTEDAKRALDTVALAMRSSQLLERKFVIEGHADRRGTPGTNLRLSQARADAVRSYMVDVQGISPERLSTVGKGDLEPLNPQSDSAAENRRVTFVTTLQ